MYDAQILKQIQCTTAEKKDLFPFIKELLVLNQKARQFGLLALEEEIPHTSDYLLKKGLALMVDGTEPEILQKILFNYTVIGEKQNKKLLKNILISEAVLSIQQGLHPNLIKDVLLSYLGTDSIEYAEKIFNDNEHYSTPLPVQTEAHNTCTLLDGPIDKIQERSLQRLLREFDYEIIATALMGASSQSQKKVLKNVSPRLVNQIVEYLNMRKDITLADITDAQKSILEMIKLLVGQGEIII